MRILFLAHLFPLPLDSGGKIKTFYTIKALAREHEVHLLTYTRLDEEERLVDEMREFCASVETVRLTRSKIRQLTDIAGSLIAGKSFIISRDYRSEMQVAFDRNVSAINPDAVHVDHLQMAQFVKPGGSYKTVLDQHNVEAAIIRRTAETDESPARRFYASKEWPKLERYEIGVCEKFDMVITVSDEDGETFRKLSPSLANLRTVPIGVDVEYFQPVKRDIESRNLLFLGTMYWPPNIDSVLYFHREIFPLVLEKFPDALLTVAGQRPSQSVQAIDNGKSVRVTGYVDDVRETSRDCGVFVVPLRSGSGVRVKILNAMAMGLPIVSTSLGAEGLDVRDGEHLLIADGEKEFADAISRILEDKGLANDLAINGRKLVCEKYSWEAVGDRLLNIYKNDLRA